MARKYRARRFEGCIYIIHLDTPLHHARHYIGFTTDIWQRFETHATGQGSPYLRAALIEGCVFRVVRLIEGDRTRERILKNRHGAAVFCPICSGEGMLIIGEELTVPDGLIAVPGCKLPSGRVCIAHDNGL